MKKLFISCPMRGRTEDEIKASMERMKAVAEIMVGEELEVIPTFIADADKNKPIYNLGVSIKRMQDADYVAAPFQAYEWRGCSVEKEVAQRYMDPRNILDIPVRVIFSSEDEYNRSTRRFVDCATDCASRPVLSEA